MIKTLKEFFETQLLKDNDKGVNNTTLSLELSAAVLMLEISLADSNIQQAERKLIKDAMINHFHLSMEDTESIISLAEKEIDHAVSLHEFTSLINKNMDNKDKVKIVELLWRVAFADAVLDKYEEYFVRKIADLLYVSHADYIKAKHVASNNP